MNVWYSFRTSEHQIVIFELLKNDGYWFFQSLWERKKFLIDEKVWSLKTVPEGIDASSFGFIVTFCIKFFEDINLPNKPLVRHHRFFCVLLYVLFSLKYSWVPYRTSKGFKPSLFMNGHEWPGKVFRPDKTRIDNLNVLKKNQSTVRQIMELIASKCQIKIQTRF